MKNKIENYKKITDYILFSFSTYIEGKGQTLRDVYVYDISKFNYILGRMENYLNDKNDLENYKMMCEYFENEMIRRDYSIDDFIEFCENNSND